jgi:hypothetical protein
MGRTGDLEINPGFLFSVCQNIDRPDQTVQPDR